MRDIPGVTISDNGGSGLKYVRIRGESNRRTLILIDGQPISQQKSMEGGMPFIGKNQIKRIEVVKGPASVLHGSEAIGGVVNIITKKGGEKEFGGSVSLNYDSSNNTFRRDFDVSGTVEGIEYAISYGRAESGNVKTPKGSLDENGYSARSGEKRLSGTGSSSEEHSVYLGYKNDKIHTGVRYDKHRMNYKIYSEPTGAEPTRDSYMNIPDSTRSKYSAFLELKDLTENFKKLKFDVYHQKTVRDFDIFIDMNMKVDVAMPFPFPSFSPVDMDYLLKTRTHNVQTSNGGNIQMDWELGDHYIIAGLNIKKDDIGGTTKTRTRIGKFTTQAGPFSPTVNALDSYEHYVYDADMLTSALYLQDEWKLSDSTILTAGVRYTQVESNLNKTNDPDITGTFPTGKANSSDDNYSFSLGLVHHLNDDLSLRANYSQGYRHANLVELYTGAPAHGSTPAKAGNPNLEAETSDSFELGARYEKDGLNIDFAVFWTEAENYITTNATQYENIGGATTLGSELAISYEFEDIGLTPYASLTYLQRKLNYGQGHSTKDSGVPTLSGRYGLKYLLEISDMSYFEADLFSRFATDTKMEYSDKTSDESKSWETLNLEVSYTIEEEESERVWNLYGGVYNIFDREYQAFDELPAAGRHFGLGLTISF